MKLDTLVLKENFSFLPCNELFYNFWNILVCHYHFKVTGINVLGILAEIEA